jgi:hypothetical protein
VEVEHGGHWWRALQAAWRVCDDDRGWTADITWTEQYEWGPGKVTTQQVLAVSGVAT